MHVPIHPAARPDGRLGRIFRPLSNLRRVFLAEQTRPKQCHDFFLAKIRLARQSRREPLAHFLAHEHGVGADVNDPRLLEQPFHERFDIRIDQRFAAADRDHGRVALLRRRQTILQAHYVLERGGIFANPATTGASEIAGMQRLELKDGGKFLSPTQLLRDHVGRYLRR